MKIKLLDVRGFGKISNRTLTPAAGFNLIYGNNESGKTTLAGFIEAMLFGIKPPRKTRNADRNEARSFKPWNSDVFSGVMECSLDNGTVFRIDRNFAQGTAHIRDASGTDVSGRYPIDRDTGPRFAETHLNIGAAVFERSALIRQMRSAVDEQGREALLEKLANLNASGAEDQSAGKALDALNTALLEKVGTGRSTTRPLDKIQARLLELEEEKARISAENERYLDTFRLLHTRKSELLELRSGLQELSGRRDARIAARLLEIRNECLECERKAAKARDDFHALGLKLSKEERFAEMTELSLETLSACLYDYLENEKRIAALQAKAEKLREKQNAAEMRLEHMTPEGERMGGMEHAASEKKESGVEAAASRVRGRRASTLFAASIAIILVAALLFTFYFLHPSGLWGAMKIPSGLFLLSGAAMLAAALIRKGRIPSGNPGPVVQELSGKGFSDLDAYLAGREELARAESDCGECRRELAETMEQTGSFTDLKTEMLHKIEMYLGTSGMGGWETQRIENAVESFKAGYRAYREDNMRLGLLEQDIGSSPNKKDALLREASAITRRDIRDIVGLSDALSALKPLTDDAPARHDSVNELEKRMDDRTNEIKACEMEIRALETRTENVPPIGRLAGILDEGAFLLERKARLEAAGKSLALAMDVLGEVSRDLRKNRTSGLDEEMGEWISRITDGKYKGITAGPGLEISLESSETERLVPAECLSGAAIDQVYFAMRLAALNLLERGGEAIPLILDEPFSQYDEIRAKNAFSLLERIASKRQIFFFTCRKRELELAQEIWGDQLYLITL